MNSETSAGAHAGLEVPVLESSKSDESLTPTTMTEAPETGQTSEAAPLADAAAPPPQSATPETTFDDLGLSDEVLKAVKESGYSTPTPIQAKGIPEVLKGRDIIGIAQTGTGKTASFTLPMIEILARGRAKARMPRSLILEPTRELAAQVAESFERYGKYNKLNMALLIGGVSFDDQDRKLDKGVDVLIATPGRLLDHFERGKLMLTAVNVFVVDEADRMLDMGFIPDVERICKLLPFTRQTLFYSATMPPEIQRLTQQFLHNPVRVEVSRPATTAANITQEIIEVPANDWAKRETLRRLIKDNPVANGIIFCNRKRDVDVVAKSLAKHGFSAAPLHGDLEQSTRMKTLDAFKNNEIQLLVASDVAARGLDIPAVSHIFNYDAPFHADDYVHRIGRTGRAGRSGHAFMLVTPRDFKSVDAIEKLIGNALPRRKIEGVEPREERSGGRERERDRGRGGRDRHSRDRDRPRPVKDHGQRASMEPVARFEAAEEVVAEPVRARENARPREHAKPRDHAKPHKQEPRETDLPANDELPDFLRHATADAAQLPHILLRPVKLPSAKTEAEEAAELAEAEASHAAEEAADAAEASRMEDEGEIFAVAADLEVEAEETPKPKRPSRRRSAKKAEVSETAAAASGEDTAEAEGAPSTDEAPKPRTRRRRKKAAPSTDEAAVDAVEAMDA
jgi:superfamily II DNA/RNA helicase